MSLIQQALQKTNRAHETKTTNSASTSKAYDRDPMGTALEQELTQAQQSYAKRRKLYWKIFLGVFSVCLVTGLSFFWTLSNHPRAKVPIKAVTVAAHAPLRIFSGTLYRLTGITNINGKSMAVINGEIVSAGDSLSGHAVVKAIGDGKVSLDVQGKEVHLTL
jgi:hypothetical protein